MSKILIIILIQIFKAKELVDNTITITKNAMSSAIVDPDRLVIGTEDGLYCIDLDQLGMYYFIRVDIMLILIINYNFYYTDNRNCQNWRS